MAIPKLYHTYRKRLMTHIGYSTLSGIGVAYAFWYGFAIPKVERRNLVMTLIEDERKMKRDALRQAEAEMIFPSQGTIEDLMGELKL